MGDQAQLAETGLAGAPRTQINLYNIFHGGALDPSPFTEPHDPFHLGETGRTALGDRATGPGSEEG